MTRNYIKCIKLHVFSEATGACESEEDVNLTTVSYPRLAFHTTNPEQK